MRPPPFFTRARDIIWGRIRRRVGFNLRAFHLTIPLYLSPLYPSISLSIPLYPSLSLSFPLFIPLSFSPSLSISFLLPFFLSLSFYLSFSLFPSLSLFSLSFSLAYLMDVFILVFDYSRTLAQHISSNKILLIIICMYTLFVIYPDPGNLLIFCPFFIFNILSLINNNKGILTRFYILESFNTHILHHFLTTK